MTVEYEIDNDGKYICSCGNFRGSRSGWYKHKAVKHSPPKVEQEIIIENVESDDEVEQVEIKNESSWMDFDQQESSNEPSQMPTPLKALHRKAVGKKGKRTKQEMESLRETSKSITMLGLTFGDTILSIWGRGVLLDPEYKIERNDRDKEITADAVVGAMEEKGVYFAESISRTAVATLMLGWYYGVPTYNITKKAKKGIFKSGRAGGILSKIPPFSWIGRRKRRRQQQMQQQQEQQQEQVMIE